MTSLAEPLVEKSPSAHDRILATASELFYREGIRAVGIDRIIAESGVAKMSLYRNFASKDDLVAAFMTSRNERYWAWWEAAIEPHAGDPRRQIRALFEALVGRLRSPTYRGCPFLNTAAELPDPQHPARLVATANKQEMKDRFRALAAEAGARNPAILSEQLALLMDGAYANHQAMGSDGPADALIDGAAVLMAAQFV